MRRPRTEKWGTFDGSEALLLFAQSIDEALFDHTVDSFKAPALNVHTLAFEAISLVNQVVEDRVRPGVLEPVLQELLARSSSSPVLSDVTTGALSQYRKRLEPKNQAKYLQATLGALLSELEGNYWIQIRRCIEDEISSNKVTKRLVDLAHIFICEAELRGFSRAYIYVRNNAIFFNTKFFPRKIKNLRPLDQFFDEFYKAECKKYCCLFRAPQPFSLEAEFAKKFGINVTDVAPDGVPGGTRAREFIAPDPERPIFVSIRDIEAMDPVSARAQAEFRLKMLASVRCFVDHSFPPNWNDRALVYVAGTNDRSLIDPPTAPMRRGERSGALFVRPSEDKVIAVLSANKLTRSSMRSLIAGMDYHRAATETYSVENQLLDLWAAIEGILPPPLGHEERIKHYLSAILPSLTLTYPEKIFRYIEGSVSEFGAATEYIDRLTIKGDRCMRLCALLTCADLSGERDKFLGLLSSSPLLVLRCGTISERFMSKNKILSTISHHQRWMSWHIQRIYSMRNQISHSARSLPYIDSLVESAHNYLDILMSSIFKVVGNSNRKMSISNAISNMTIHCDAFTDDLKGNDELCTSATFARYVFGASNPLSPIYKHFISGEAEEGGCGPRKA